MSALPVASARASRSSCAQEAGRAAERKEQQGLQVLPDASQEGLARQRRLLARLCLQPEVSEEVAPVLHTVRL